MNNYESGLYSNEHFLSRSQNKTLYKFRPVRHLNTFENADFVFVMLVRNKPVK